MIIRCWACGHVPTFQEHSDAMYTNAVGGLLSPCPACGDCDECCNCDMCVQDDNHDAAVFIALVTFREAA